MFYWRTVRLSALSEYSGISTSGVALFALLLYSILMWFAKRLAGAQSIERVHASLYGDGLLLLLIVFVGLVVMLYVQNLVRRKHEALERERTSTASGVEGTGLGLAITKNLVDLMGGTIEVITSPGAGTEFILRLQFRLATEEELRQEEAPAPASVDRALDFTQYRLLLVEDNAVNREIACMLLSQAGFLLETAENGQIAVDMVTAAENGYYDMILMDIQMPVMDGYTATRAIRTLDDPTKAGIPIVAMTANAFKEDERAAAAGMQAHIAKPLDTEKMLDTIRSVLLQS